MPSLNTSFRKLLRWQSETISISIVSVPLLVSTFENSPYALPVLFRLKYFSVFAEFNLCKFVAGLHVAACQNEVDFNMVKLTKKEKRIGCLVSFPLLPLLLRNTVSFTSMARKKGSKGPVIIYWRGGGSLIFERQLGEGHYFVNCM